MGLLDYVATPPQRVAYMFPELSGAGLDAVNKAAAGSDRASSYNTRINDVFVFQFWPKQVQDNYTPNWVTKNIPGASHPIFQWSNGNGRDISFTAEFVTELREDSGFSRTKTNDFRSRITAAEATSGLTAASTLPGGLAALLLPSSRYVTNVAAAIAALQRYLYPTYPQNVAKAPERLILVLPGTKMGRSDGADGILCIMRSASVTQESWFPTGEIRSASVALKFSEVIQFSGTGNNVSKIKYIGAESYRGLADRYTATVANPGELALS